MAGRACRTISQPGPNVTGQAELARGAGLRTPVIPF